jgi:hypothetical protein
MPVLVGSILYVASYHNVQCYGCTVRPKPS